MSQSRILLGLLSAHHPSRWAYRRGARQAFLKDCPLDHIYILGRPPVDDWPYAREKDEIWVDCDDRKEWMVLKNQALFRYALDNGYDYCFRACDDTFLFPDRIISAGLEPFDYAGQCPCKFSLGGTFKVWMAYLDYMHGGCGIWLSRKAMEMLVADDWKGPDHVQTMPERFNIGLGIMYERFEKYWDDHWIGEVLKGNLSWDDPIRMQPVQAYTRNGIRVYEDDMLFYNDEPMRAISIHDPGVHKPNAQMMDDIKKQFVQLNMEMMNVVGISK